MKKRPKDCDLISLVLSSNGEILAGQTCTMVARPQVLACKPFFCLVEANIAPFFGIEDIRVGNRSMFQQFQSLPATHFSTPPMHAFNEETRKVVQELIDLEWISAGRHFDCETVQTAMDFAMIVTNISGDPHRFTATWDAWVPKFEPPRQEQGLFQMYSPNPAPGMDKWNRVRPGDISDEEIRRVLDTPEPWSRVAHSPMTTARMPPTRCGDCPANNCRPDCEEKMTEEKKGFIDNLFDTADAVLDRVEPAMSAVPTRRELREAPKRSAQPEGWQEVVWAPAASGTWHAFSEADHSICGLATEDLSPTQTTPHALEHGKVLSMCTSCVIGVSR